jgi:hypothetical protein
MTALQPGVRWQLALAARDIEGALELAAEAADPVFARLVIDAWNAEDPAREQLDSRCSADPRDIEALIWCARVGRRSGNLQRAGELTYIANVQFPGTYRSAGELRVDVNPRPAYPVLEGGASIAWGTYTYRRVTAWDVLVPGLLRLTVQ